MERNGIPPTVRAAPSLRAHTNSRHIRFTLSSSSLVHQNPYLHQPEACTSPAQYQLSTLHPYEPPSLLTVPRPRRFGVELAHCPKKRVEEYESPIPAILVFLKFVRSVSGGLGLGLTKNHSNPTYFRQIKHYICHAVPISALVLISPFSVSIEGWGYDVMGVWSISKYCLWKVKVVTATAMQASVHPISPRPRPTPLLPPCQSEVDRVWGSFARRNFPLSAIKGHRKSCIFPCLPSNT